MKCLKCGAYALSSDKFCGKCGTALNNTCEYGDNIPNSKYDASSCHEKQYSYSYEYSNKEQTKYDMKATHEQQYNYNTNYSYNMNKFDYAYQPNDSSENKYIKAYIGNNYENIKNTKFSMPSLLLGPIYFIYRKIWKYAILAIIIEITATLLLKSFIANITSIIINIYLAYNFQQIYLKQAEEKTEMIKQQNLDKSTNELLEICRKKGGTATIITIRIIAAIIFLVYILYMISTGYFTGDKIPTKNTFNYDEVYNLQLDKLNYSIPKKFQQNDSSQYMTNFTYDVIDKYTQETTKCAVTIEAINSFSADELTITELNSILNSKNTENTITYNNIDWVQHSIPLVESLYLHKYNETIYTIKMTETSEIYCTNEYTKILNSLTFTK